MTTLRDLHEGLTKLARQGGGNRLYFYASSPSGRLRHGYFLVIDQERCQINFEGMDPEDALAELPTLEYVKIDRLAMPSTQAAMPGDTLEIRHVLNMIDPDIHQQMRKPAPVLQPPPVVAEPAVEEAAGGVVLLRLRLRDLAVEALEPYLGNGAAKRVDALAVKFPPVHKPREFLLECQSAASMIVGSRKAEEVFRPLFAKLSD